MCENTSDTTRLTSSRCGRPIVFPSSPPPPLQVLQLAMPCGCLLQACSRHVPPSRHLVLVQCSGLPWGTPRTHRLAEKNSTGRGGEWQHSLWWLWFSVVNHTPPHPTPHPPSGLLFTTSYANHGSSVCDIMSKGPANGWGEVHETRWWWCEVMCPWEGRGSLCVTAVGCLSCQGCIHTCMVCVLLLHCPGTVLSCHFWSHRKDSSSCASENCATHTSITHAHTQIPSHVFVCLDSCLHC